MTTHAYRRAAVAICALIGLLGAAACSRESQPDPGPTPPATENDRFAPFAVIHPSAPQEERDRALLTYYRAWEEAFVRQDCGPGTMQVYSPDAGYPYVAEAQGYGLVITAMMSRVDPAARTVFDGLLAYVLAHPSSRNAALTAAEQDSDCNDRAGGNSATDGDMDVAYGLLVADQLWGSSGRYNYRQLAEKRIQALKSSAVNPSSELMLLGDWSTEANADLYATSRTSDWMPYYFRAFEKATGDTSWSSIRIAHQRAITRLQSSASPDTGLLPDFVRTTADGVRPVTGQVLESDHDGAYSFNACRTPWRIGTDAVLTGDAETTAAARKISAWFRSTTGEDPDTIGSGYQLDGTVDRSSGNNAFWAPLAVSAMTDPDAQQWLDQLWEKLATSEIETAGYYGDTIQLQVMILVSGNYVAV